MKKIRVLGVLAIALASVSVMASTGDAHSSKKSSKLDPPLVVEEQGSISAGAQILKNPGEDGGEFHHDYLYSNFMIPKHARKNSLVMWHGCWGTIWERRQDGGPGFQSLLTQRRFSTFVIDAPRANRGARGLGAYSFNAVTSGNNCQWSLFRFGTWSPPAKRAFFPGVQLARDPQSAANLCEYAGSPGGPTAGFPGTSESRAVPRNAVLALLERKAGNSVLVTHSASGLFGWETVALGNSRKIKGIVSYEPAAWVFPSDAPPPDLPGCCTDPAVAARMVPILISPAEFNKLTKIPIQIIFADNLDKNVDVTFNEQWTFNPMRAKQFVAEINKRGGDAEYVHLPTIGVRGNTHFPMFDLNNEKIADLLVHFLKRKNLDGGDHDDDDDDHHHR